MRFGRTLRKSIYPPWKDQYIDYDKLKKLLKETGSSPGSPIDGDEEDPWTEEDESAFVEELVNVQLEKVHDFQKTQHQTLKDRIVACEARLEPLTSSLQEATGEDGANKDQSEQEKKKGPVAPEERERVLKEELHELDNITKEVNELERYSRINYTGFLKAAKKHDRRRGHDYKIKPLLLVRLAALPFNTEDYSSLIYRLSAVYSFVRQNLDGKEHREMSFAETQTGGEDFVSHKFWVHPENITEVKTIILRRLPVLVYNPQTSKIAEGSQRDPTITSIYFDNPKFSLYSDKVSHTPNAASLRLRWYGQLSDKPEIFLEKKVINEGGASQEQRFTIKDKYVQSFIKGDYKMEKSVNKLQEKSGENSEAVDDYRKAVDDIQALIRSNHLQPVLRANYTRTAFQIPGDDRVRISIDTDLALIREDALDTDRPCRDPKDWHRRDIDDNEMEYPFSGVRKGEINAFPFALLEIKIRGKKKYEWVSDLMGSHLVKEATNFSKFVHGVAVLFEDHVNTFPFWLSELESDIRRDPFKAFEEEQERNRRAAEDELAVGSFLGTKSSPYKAAIASPVGSPSPASKSLQVRTPSKTPGSLKITAEMTRRASQAGRKPVRTDRNAIVEEPDSDDDGIQGNREESAFSTTAGLRSLFPSFSTSKYARAHRHIQAPPPGVQDPGIWIKDQGPVRVEAKVWLANQRTFVKWQHVCVLLATLSLGLFNAAGETNNIARGLALAYTSIAVFTGVWGWAIYVWRSRMIEQRSGVDFDNRLGPTVVCIGLIIALMLNFGFKYHSVMQDRRDGKHGHHQNGTHGVF